MRATISFDIELDKVEETMGALVSQESDTLRVAANILSNAGRDTLLEEVTEAIDLLEATNTQLQQYRDMLVGFERAKFETILPQPADTPPQALGQVVHNMEELKDKLAKVSQFGEFVDRINSNLVTEASPSADLGQDHDQGENNEEG